MDILAIDEAAVSAARRHPRSVLLDASSSYVGCYDAFTTRSLMGIDRVNNRMFINNTSQILQTEDQGTTLSTNKTVPTNMTSGTMRKMLLFKGNNYLAAVDSVSASASIYQAAPQSGSTAFSWTKVHTATGVGGHIGTGFNVVTDAGGADLALVYVEYSDPAGGPQIWRSTNGTTWTSVLGPVSGMRHFHAVAQDPFNPAVVYATGGDGSVKQIWKSTDFGVTWAIITADPNWQAVQISFTAEWVWFAGDSARGSVFVMDRATNTCRWLPDNHRNIPVPNPLPRSGGQIFADGASTFGNKTITSATAGFANTFDKNDVGREVIFPSAVYPRTYITGVGSGTSVQVSQNSQATLTGQTFILGGDQFYWSAFYGIADPDTGFYYFTANDTTSGGNRSGLFVHTGQQLILLESFGPSVISPGTVGSEHFIYAGKLWMSGKSRELLTATRSMPGA